MQNVGTKSAFMPIFIELFFLFTSLSFLFYYFYRNFFFFFNEFVLLSVFPLLPNYKSSGFLQ